MLQIRERFTPVFAARQQMNVPYIYIYLYHIYVLQTVKVRTQIIVVYILTLRYYRKAFYDE